MSLYVFPTHEDLGGGGIGSTVAEPMWQTLNRMFCKPGDGFVYTGFTVVYGTGINFSVAAGWAMCGGYVCHLTENYSLANKLTLGVTNYVWLGVKATATAYGAYTATEADIYVTTTQTPPAGVTFWLRLMYITVSTGGNVQVVANRQPIFINNITSPTW